MFYICFISLYLFVCLLRRAGKLTGTMAFRHFTLCCIYPIACWTRLRGFFFPPKHFSDPKQNTESSIWHLKVLSCVKGYHEEKRQLKGLKKARQGARNEGKRKKI